MDELKDTYQLINNVKEYSFDCDCGKKFKVVTNKYDNSNSGQASCDCGKCRSVIN